MSSILQLKLGQAYLIRGTVEALLDICPVRPRFLHSYGCKLSKPDLLPIAAGDPYSNQCFVVEYQYLPMLPQPAPNVCLCVLVCDFNAEQDAKAKKFIKANACDAVPFVDLVEYSQQILQRPDVSSLLQRYTLEAQAELQYVSRFPKRLLWQLQQDRFEAAPIPLERVNPFLEAEQYLCTTLCNALLEPNPQSLWEGLTRQQRFLLFSEQTQFMKNFLCGTGRAYGRCPALWLCMEPFFRLHRIDEAMSLFLAWFRWQQLTSSYYEGLWRSPKNFYIFKPTEEALKALQSLDLTMPYS